MLLYHLNRPRTQSRRKSSQSSNWNLHTEVNGLRENGKKSVIFTILVGIYFGLGIAVFHWVEDCHGRKTHMDDDRETAKQICMDLIRMRVLNVTGHTHEENMDGHSDIDLHVLATYEKWTKYMGHKSNLTVHKHSVSHTSRLTRTLNTCVRGLLKVWKLIDEEENLHADANCDFSLTNVAKWVEFIIATIYTIGYGNIVPQSNAGKILTILYSAIGIPLSITMYTFVGKFLMSVCDFSIKYFESRLLKRNAVSNLPLKILLVSAAMFISVLFLAASITSHHDLEDMAMLDSIYFWWVTLSTIGYGDFNFEFEKYLASHQELILPINLLLVLGLGMTAAVFGAGVQMLSQGSRCYFCFHAPNASESLQECFKCKRTVTKRVEECTEQQRTCDGRESRNEYWNGFSDVNGNHAIV